MCVLLCVREYVHEALTHRDTREQEAARLKSDLFLYCELVCVCMCVRRRECERKLTLIHIRLFHCVLRVQEASQCRDRVQLIDI